MTGPVMQTSLENEVDVRNPRKTVLRMLREVLHGGDKTELLQYLDKANDGDGEVFAIPSEYLAPLIRGETFHVMNGPQTDAIDKRELAKHCAAYIVREGAEYFRMKSGKRGTPRTILVEIEKRAIDAVNKHFGITMAKFTIIGPELSSDMETQKRHGLHERQPYGMPEEVVASSNALHSTLIGILDWLDETYFTPRE